MSNPVVKAAKKKIKQQQQRTQQTKEKKKQRVTGKKHKLPFDNNSDGSDDEKFKDGKKNSIKEYMEENNTDLLESALDEDTNFIEFDKHFDEELTVDFDVNVPDVQNDFFGVELFLKNYLHGAPFDSASLVEMVLGDSETNTPNPFTSVIKVGYDNASAPAAAASSSTTTTSTTESSKKKKSSSKKMETESDDEESEGGNQEIDVSTWEWNDIYGVVTMLDYHKHRKLEFMKQIKDYILSKCKEVKIKQQLKEIFENGKLGIIINERVLNLPTEIAPDLHENLFDEVENSIRNEKCTFFKHYLIMTRIYYHADMRYDHDQRLIEHLTGHEEVKNKKKKQKKVLLPQEEASCEQNYLQQKTNQTANFLKPEEELYYVRSKAAFSFELPNEYTQDTRTMSMDSLIANEVLVMVVEREKVRKILKRIRELFNPEGDESKQQEASESKE